MILSNFHTHTSFCDGKDTPEELVLFAIEKGCSEIGFSGHSYVDFDERACMSPSDFEEYKREILALREKYGDKINILLGIEQDSYTKARAEGVDYIIGSVHYVFKDGEYLFVDFSREQQIEDVEKHYGGDFYAYVEDYYDEVGKLYEKTGCDIVGHFDLVTKFNENGDLFDVNHPRYIKAAEGALQKLLPAPVIFEVNTGAISRGYRKTAYLNDSLRSKIAESGRPFLLSSDCHAKENLLFGLDTEKEKLERAGYKTCLSSKDFLKK